MNIKRNIIFAPESRKKDGIPVTKNVPIRMRVIFASQRIEFTTGYRIDVEKWDTDKQRVRNGCTNKLKQSASEINAELLRQYTEIQNVFKEFEVQDVIPTPAQIKEAFNLKTKGEKKENHEEKQKVELDFMKVFNEFVAECSKQNDIAEQCREVGFTEELTRRVVSLQPVEFKGRLYSKEHKEKFRTEHSTATVERNPQEKGKFRLCIDGMPILEWFKMKFQELKEKLGVSHTQKEENKPKRGLRL